MPCIFAYTLPHPCHLFLYLPQPFIASLFHIHEWELSSKKVYVLILRQDFIWAFDAVSLGCDPNWWISKLAASGVIGCWMYLLICVWLEQTALSIIFQKYLHMEIYVDEMYAYNTLAQPSWVVLLLFILLFHFTIMNIWYFQFVKYCCCWCCMLNFWQSCLYYGLCNQCIILNDAVLDIIT